MKQILYKILKSTVKLAAFGLLGFVAYKSGALDTLRRHTVDKIIPFVPEVWEGTEQTYNRLKEQAKHNEQLREILNKIGKSDKNLWKLSSPEISSRAVIGLGLLSSYKTHVSLKSPEQKKDKAEFDDYINNETIPELKKIYGL